MFKVSAALLSLLVAPSLYAQTTCKNPTLHDFTVYSIGNIDVQQSDYQGMTGAGGFILARNFQFNSNPANCLAVAVGGDLGINSAAINGNTEAGGTAGINSTGARGDVVATDAFINSSNVRGNVVTVKPLRVQYSGIGGSRKRSARISLRADHSQISNELRLESSYLKYQTPNNSIKIQGSDVVIALKPGANILTFLRPADLNNAKRIFITGDASSTAVINIPGDQIILDGQDVILSSQVRVSNITWNFHETSFLQITHTHNGKLGMPGIVMAPNALVVFNEALITGALYAGEIVTNMTDSTLNAGQVNIEPNPAPTPTPTPAPPAPAPKPN